MGDWIKYIAIYILIIGAILGASYYASEALKNYEVIEPERGIKCVVVSRTFNTSVACWQAQ